jgi:hypothetical protein
MCIDNVSVVFAQEAAVAMFTISSHVRFEEAPHYAQI